MGLARDDWPQNDPATWPRLEAELTARFATRNRDEWSAAFADLDACVTPVLDLAEAARDLHQTARGVFVAEGGITQAAPAPRFAATPSRPTPSRTLALDEAIAGFR